MNAHRIIRKRFIGLSSTSQTDESLTKYKSTAPDSKPLMVKRLCSDYITKMKKLNQINLIVDSFNKSSNFLANIKESRYFNGNAGRNFKRALTGSHELINYMTYDGSQNSYSRYSEKRTKILQQHNQNSRFKSISYMHQACVPSQKRTLPLRLRYMTSFHQPNKMSICKDTVYKRNRKDPCLFYIKVDPSSAKTLRKSDANIMIRSLYNKFKSNKPSISRNPLVISQCPAMCE